MAMPLGGLPRNARSTGSRALRAPRWETLILGAPGAARDAAKGSGSVLMGARAALALTHGLRGT